MNRTINEKSIRQYMHYLCAQERSTGTKAQYIRAVQSFERFLADRPLTKENAVAWREALSVEGYAPTTINSKIAALNGFFQFIHREDCRLRFLKVQKNLYRDAGRVLTKGEYQHLVSTAYEQGKKRTALIMETICASGLRVSELHYITVEAVKYRSAQISMKGKIRTILLSKKLCQKLLRYAKENKITAGEIFLTSGGKGIGRGQIWADMKKICRIAGVSESKVFPHNLRHLFAAVFYSVCKDVIKLADILGHSDVNTTRIYLAGTSTEMAQQIERLRLVS